MTFIGMQVLSGVSSVFLVSSIVWRLLGVGGRLVRRRVVARGLERNLLVDDDCGVGWDSRTVDIALGTVGLHLLQQGEDDEENGQVE